MPGSVLGDDHCESFRTGPYDLDEAIVAVIPALTTGLYVNVPDGAHLDIGHSSKVRDCPIASLNVTASFIRSLDVLSQRLTVLAAGR
jgi:hypothetical protein